jgi:hypothetical protein
MNEFLARPGRRQVLMVELRQENGRFCHPQSTMVLEGFSPCKTHRMNKTTGVNWVQSTIIVPGHEQVGTAVATFSSLSSG